MINDVTFTESAATLPPSDALLTSDQSKYEAASKLVEEAGEMLWRATDIIRDIRGVEPGEAAYRARMKSDINCFFAAFWSAHYGAHGMRDAIKIMRASDLSLPVPGPEIL